MNYETLISNFFNIIIKLAKPTIIILWNFTVKYALNPNYSYKQFITPTNGFLNFYYFIFNSIYSDIIILAMLISTVSLLIYNSFIEPYSPSKLLIKFMAAIILFESSYRIAIFILSISSIFYSSIYGLTGNWDNIIFINLSISNNILSLLFTGSFILAIAMLFGVLIIRQALIIFFILILPVSSILLMIPNSSKTVIKFYRLFFELSFFPFFSIMMLYTLNFFNNVFLEIGIIYVSATAPIFFMTELYGYFRNSFNFITSDAVLSDINMGYGGITPGDLLNSGGIRTDDRSFMDATVPGIVGETGGIN
ncbi:MAG: hypothetical protein QXZ44_06175 [Ferroplasma sp.]